MSERLPEIPAPLLNVLRNLEEVGHQPVLVGGVALVLAGYPQVTHDFDFVVGGDSIPEKVRVCETLYNHGFRLINRVDPENRTAMTWTETLESTLDRVKAADANVVFFWHPDSQIRIDILFDFPLPAAELIAHAQRVEISPGRTIAVASLKDLHRMKVTAYNWRRHPKDLLALEFLDSILKKQ